MMEIHGKVKASQSISGSAKSTSAINGELDNEIKNRLYRDYNLLHNKPSVEDITLEGNKTLEDLGIERFLYGTTEYWNSYSSLIAQRGTIYIYIDHEEVEGEYVPGFKVGDGTSYLIDMPYTDTYLNISLTNHINDIIRHITQAEREKWNNKVSVSISNIDEENLVFTNG